MLTTAGHRFRKLVLVLLAGLASGTVIHGQAPSNPFTVPSLTLTGTAKVASSTKYYPDTLAELMQKIQGAVDSKDYVGALDFVNYGLAGRPVDPQLLKAKAIILARLHRYHNAAAVFKNALVQEPDNMDLISSLAEILLIAGQITEYRAFESQHKAQIDAAYDGMLSKYLEVLAVYQTGDEKQVRDTTTRVLASLPAKKGPLLGDWAFEELIYSTSLQPSSKKKGILMTFLRVLTGDLDRDQALKIIQGL